MGEVREGPKFLGTEPRESWRSGAERPRSLRFCGPKKRGLKKCQGAALLSIGLASLCFGIFFGIAQASAQLIDTGKGSEHRVLWR